MKVKAGVPLGGIPAFWHGAVSVSYTHLDVYKRQAIICSGSEAYICTVT